MKILYILGTFPKLASETFIVNEMIELKKLGHEVKILAFHKSKKVKINQEIISSNLLSQAYYADKDRSLTRYQFIKTFLIDFSKNPLHTLKIIYKILPIIQDYKRIPINYFSIREASKFDFDIMYIQFPHVNHLSQALYLSKIYKKPFIVVFRALDLYEKESLKILKKRINLLKNSSKTITISKYNVGNLIKKFKLKDNINITHSAINIDKFSPAKTRKKNKNKIIAVCRFVEKKGVKYLIESMKIIHKKNKNINLTIIGTGPEKENYLKLIKENNLEKNIIIKGPLMQEEIKKEIENSVMFILPCIIARNNDRDILPNVLKEAMAMEIPVITSNICGIEELVEHNKTGILVPEKNPQAIADAIEKLSKNHTLRVKLGKQARQKIIKDFNVKKEAKKTEKILQKIIQKYKI